MSSKVITIIVGVLAAAILIGAIVYDSMNKSQTKEDALYNPEPQPQVSIQEETGPKIDVPAVTGNIDEAVNSFLSEVDSEQNFVGDDTAEANLIKSDSFLIDDIGQSTGDENL